MSIGEVTVEAVLKQMIEQDRPEIAYQWMDALAEKLPDSPRITARLCESAILLGNRNRAMKYLFKLEQQVPANSTFATLKAHVETHFGSPTQAVSILDSLVFDEKLEYASQMLKAQAYFRAGQFISALQAYESRRSLLIQRINPDDKLLRKMWQSGTTPSKKLCIWREQGVGDELVFLSRVPRLLTLGYEVKIVAAPCLVKFLQLIFGNDRVCSSKDPDALAFANTADTFVFAGSLPLLLYEVSGEVLHAPEIDGSTFFQNTGVDNRVGIAWRTTSKVGDERRALPFEPFIATLNEFWKGEIAVIQADITAEEDKLLRQTFGNRYIGQVSAAGIGEPKDVLADELVKCSAVFGVSTTVCFLAYFLDIPTILLLPFGADTRWRYQDGHGLLPGVVRLMEQAEDDGRHRLGYRLKEFITQAPSGQHN